MDLPKTIQFLEQQIGRLEKNLSRARNLVRIAEHIRKNPISQRTLDISDVLRSATVLTHASMEDFLRALSEVFLPKSGEETLNNIPLVGQKGRAEKFLLGKLTNHRGKTVEQIIEESVQSYLMNTNYNDTNDISTLLSSFNLDIKEISVAFTLLNELMKRRHQIVHRADKFESKKGLRTMPIQAKKVNEWINAVDDFSVKVLAQCTIQEMRKNPS